VLLSEAGTLKLAWLSHGSANQQAGLFLLQRNSAEG